MRQQRTPPVARCSWQTTGRRAWRGASTRSGPWPTSPASSSGGASTTTSTGAASRLHTTQCTAVGPLHHPPPCAGVDGAGADPEQRRHGGRGAGPADQLHVRHPGGLHLAARLHRGLQRHQLRLRVRRQLRGAGGGEHGGRARLAGGLARGQHRGRLLHPERGPGDQGGARAPGGGRHTALNQIQMIIQQLYYRIDIFIDK